MTQSEEKQIALSRTGLYAGLLLAAIAGGLIFFWLNPDTPPPQTIIQPEPAPAPKAIATPAAKPLPKPKPAKPTSKPVPAKTTPPVVKTVTHNNDFVIQGLLSTGGEPWAANMILVKILWLKNKNRQRFMLGKEISMAQATSNGFVYRIKLRPPAKEFLNWNGGVEGNIGRVVAFLDNKRDGRLTLKKDKIIAVSKELIRYRTGRYDKNLLNEAQQQNIKQAGKGYAIVRNMQVGENKLDWKVVAQKSPARLDLSAAETSLPNMYNTFMKLQ